MEKLRFTLVGKKRPVVLVDKDGNEKEYVLEELTGKGRDEYLTSIADKMRFDEKGQMAGLKSFDGLQASLLARTLKDEKGQFVPIAEIQQFPAAVLNSLYEVAQALNGLDKVGVDEVKNG